jgi:hypothetical protein
LSDPLLQGLGLPRSSTAALRRSKRDVAIRDAGPAGSGGPSGPACNGDGQPFDTVSSAPGARVVG